MSNNKQNHIGEANKMVSSVELFAIVLYERGYLQGNGDEINDLLERHKEMHRREHGQTWADSICNLQERRWNENRAHDDFDDYYDETYGGNK